MALLTSSLGNLSGKLGNLVFSVRNGKNIVAKAPKQRKVPMGEEQMAHARKFGAAGKITGVINSCPDLQEIWKKHYKTKKSVFTKIFKSIYRMMNGKEFKKSGSVMPDHGFAIKGRVTLGMHNILVETDAPGEMSGISEEKEKFIQAVGIIVFGDPVNNTLPETKAAPIFSWPPEELKIFEEQVFLFALNRDQQEEMQSYRKKEFHIHLVTRDDCGEVASYSEMIEL